VLEHTRLADHAVWGVALLLYAYDAARLLGPRDVLLVEAGGGRLVPTVSDPPFSSWTRVLAFEPLHLPQRGVFVTAWGRPWRDDAALKTTLASLARLRGSLGPVRAAATAAALLLFVVGPALTLVLGPNAAVLYTAAALYPTALVAVAALWWRRRRFGLGAARCALLSVEVLVCPAFLPNLVRKLTGTPPLAADAVQILRATGAADVTAALVATIQRRSQEALEADDADPSAQAELRAYLASIGPAP
jgi:hypothetical protein